MTIYILPQCQMPGTTQSYWLHTYTITLTNTKNHYSPRRSSSLFPMLEATLIFTIILFIFYLLKKSTRTHGKNSPPMVKGAWPIIGHIRLLGGPKLPHIVLGELADKYGPVFTIKLGVHRALVVSNWEIAKDCLKDNDKIFCNRPRFIAIEHMGYNHAMFGFHPYGPYWREMRRITFLKLFSSQRVAGLSHHRESVLASSTLSTYEKCLEEKSLVVEMKRWFGDLSIEVIFRIVAGKSFTELGKTMEGELCRKALREFFDLSGMFTVGDTVPFLRCLDVGGYEKRMKKVGKELDKFLSEWLLEHKQNRNDGRIKEQDFIDIMLSDLDNSMVEESSFDADTIIKSTCLALILGATDTTTITATWALSLLLNNPSTLKKAQNELDKHIGRERQVQESDIKNLEYLQAIVKETLRLYPPSQLIPQRESVENCHISGYNVPAGTRLIVNLWKIHRDPRVWANPLEFKPERFLSSENEIDIKGQDFELLPFGSGRRICPGMVFGLQAVQFTLASFLHSFNLKIASGECVDMSETFGLSNIKALPLEVVLTPRLPAQLYG